MQDDPFEFPAEQPEPQPEQEDQDVTPNIGDDDAADNDAIDGE